MYIQKKLTHNNLNELFIKEDKMSRRNNIKKNDTATKEVKADKAFNRAAESKVEKKNMTYTQKDFFNDKV
ncbi:Conserved hypothetical protein [Clostridium acetobutylicum EA 2018]|nr:Conserved hypothetical protein [Clostridium acetobutylicum EA 2018]